MTSVRLGHVLTTYHQPGCTLIRVFESICERAEGEPQETRQVELTWKTSMETGTCQVARVPTPRLAWRAPR